MSQEIHKLRYGFKSWIKKIFTNFLVLLRANLSAIELRNMSCFLFVSSKLCDNVVESSRLYLCPAAILPFPSRRLILWNFFLIKCLDVFFHISKGLSPQSIYLFYPSQGLKLHHICKLDNRQSKCAAFLVLYPIMIWLFYPIPLSPTENSISDLKILAEP